MVLPSFWFSLLISRIPCTLTHVNKDNYFLSCCQARVHVPVQSLYPKSLKIKSACLINQKLFWWKTFMVKFSMSFSIIHWINSILDWIYSSLDRIQSRPNPLSSSLDRNQSRLEWFLSRLNYQMMINTQYLGLGERWKFNSFRF